MDILAQLGRNSVVGGRGASAASSPVRAKFTAGSVPAEATTLSDPVVPFAVAVTDAIPLAFAVAGLPRMTALTPEFRGLKVTETVLAQVHGNRPGHSAPAPLRSALSASGRRCKRGQYGKQGQHGEAPW
jgi:hypothetical protein